MRKHENAYFWIESCNYIGEIELTEAGGRDFLAGFVDWAKNLVGSEECTDPELTQIGTVTRLTMRYQRHLTFAVYVGKGAKKLARSERDALPAMTKAILVKTFKRGT
jgi:hypothetical protein